MKRKRFEKKVYRCWAYELSDGHLWTFPDVLPDLDTNPAPGDGETPIPVIVTVERDKKRGKS